MSRRILVFFVLFALLAACGALKSTLDCYEYLPYLLSRHSVVQNALDDPDRANVERANRYLEDLNTRAHATVTYLIRANGTCVAARTGTAAIVL